MFKHIHSGWSEEQTWKIKGEQLYDCIYACVHIHVYCVYVRVSVCVSVPEF